MPEGGKLNGKLIEWTRPPSYWEAVAVHLPFAFVTGTLLLGAVVVHFSPRLILPCTFRRLVGYPCPFCGSSRAFEAAAFGRWAEAWHTHPFATLLFAVVAVFFFVNAFALATGLKITRGKFLRPGKTGAQVFWIGVGVALLATWLYRLLMGFDS
ncbi:MAG: DUF2752 domain-containing protein [Verrucomicrobia bacterium]|nr:DUF2752 domain-containing protein [Verrucomicrobiota bacterium]